MSSSAEKMNRNISDGTKDLHLTWLRIKLNLDSGNSFCKSGTLAINIILIENTSILKK